MVPKSRPLVTVAGVSQILGLPAIVPDFTGRLHFGMEKSVQIWSFLKEGIRVGVSLLDFFLSTPVLQVPVFVVGGSGVIAYLSQFGLNLLTNNLGTKCIFKGINYLSFYIFILLLQFIFNQNKKLMSRIRGKKSGNLPERHNWEISNLDFAFLWVWCGILLFSPIIGMGVNIFLGAFSLFKGWENFVVGYLCWLIIFLLLRLTAFLPEQRHKLNLILMALVLMFLSFNVGTASQECPLYNQINSFAGQFKFQLVNNLEDGAKLIHNQNIHLARPGYLAANLINFSDLPTNSKLAITLGKGSANQRKNHPIIPRQGNYLSNHLQNSISFPVSQFHRMLDNNVVVVSPSTIGNQISTLGNQESHGTKQEIILFNRRTVLRISHLIHGQLPLFFLSELNEALGPTCVGQWRLNKQVTSLARHRLDMRAWRSGNHIPFTVFGKRCNACRGGELASNGLRTKHVQIGLSGTWGTMERVLTMASFPATVQRSYQPAGYFQDYSSLVLKSKWDELSQHLVTPV